MVELYQDGRCEPPYESVCLNDVEWVGSTALTGTSTNLKSPVTSVAVCIIFLSST